MLVAFGWPAKVDLFFPFVELLEDLPNAVEQGRSTRLELGIEEIKVCTHVSATFVFVGRCCRH